MRLSCTYEQTSIKLIFNWRRVGVAITALAVVQMVAGSMSGLWQTFIYIGLTFVLLHSVFSGPLALCL